MSVHLEPEMTNLVLDQYGLLFMNTLIFRKDYYCYDIVTKYYYLFADVTFLESISYYMSTTTTVSN